MFILSELIMLSDSERERERERDRERESASRRVELGESDQLLSCASCLKRHAPRVTWGMVSRERAAQNTLPFNPVPKRLAYDLHADLCVLVIAALQYL